MTKAISSLPLFLSFKKHELKELLTHSSIRTLQKNEFLFHAHDKCDTVFIVLSGAIAILKTLKEVTQIIEIVNAGEHLCEYALYNTKSLHEHSAQVVSEQAEIVGIPGKIFKKFAPETQRKLLFNLLPALSDTIYHATNRILAVFETGEVLAGMKSTTDLGQAVIEIVLSAIHAKGGLIALKEVDPTKTRIIARSGFGKNELPTDAFSLSLDPFLCEIILQAKILNLSEAEYLMGDKKVPYVAASLLGIPLQAGEHLQGAIVLVDKKQQGSFNTNNIVLLSTIAHMTALGLSHARERELHHAQQELKQHFITS